MKSDLGKIDLQGSLDPGRDIYSVKSVFTDLNLGKILNNQLLGDPSPGQEIFQESGIKGKAINGVATIHG